MAIALLSVSDPRREYERRLHDRQASAAKHDVLNNRISTARGLVFLSAVGLLVLAGATSVVSTWVFALPAAIFLSLVIWHGRVSDRLKIAQTAARYYETGLNRLDDQWGGVGTNGERYQDTLHVYSGDLDVFGSNSLFQLLSRARTRLGEDTLAAWLSAPAPPDVLNSRRECVKDLWSNLDLREQLALLDAEVHDDLNQNLLHAWAGETPQPVSPIYLAISFILPVTAICTLAGWLFWNTRLTWVVLSLIPLTLFTLLFRRQLKDLSENIRSAGSGLAILAQVLGLLEREKFSVKPLQEMRSRIESAGSSPSKHIAKLNRLIENLNNSLQNQFFAPIAFLLALPVHLIHSIETWRAKVGPKIPEWLAAVGEFEALVSLAGYAYEQPNDPYPEIVEGESPVFDGEQIGHPLIPKDQCVQNDVKLDLDRQLILVSGSNMSGKSTLLRTVGTNVVLALAGAPVRAKSLNISPLQLGTAMRIQDSLQDGKSLFFAVISRVKSVVDLAGNSPPLLFLLDEILQGTNSHDRRVGAEGIIRKLVADKAIGIVTTHDLALTKIVELFGSKAINCHFQDQLEDGRMTFDYCIRPGIVEKSNALELMRMMGLDV